MSDINLSAKEAKVSVFTKVSILFIISLSTMIFITIKTNLITQGKIELIQKQRYIQASKELFRYLSLGDKKILNEKIHEMKFEKISDIKKYLRKATVIYNYKSAFGEIKILKRKEKYLLFMQYLNDRVLIKDISDNENIEEQSLLNYLVLGEILILMVIFSIIIKILLPLKSVSRNLQKVADGDYSQRINVKTKDEIGTLCLTFNLMASNLEKLINSRQRLLKDIGHELKTPISKSKLALEFINSSKYKNILTKAINQIDMMISELLYMEKLNSHNPSLNTVTFEVTTLLSEALSKMLIEDESLIKVDIKEDFNIKGDLNYLSIALKNLIDNALKYSTKKPIFIIVQKDKILVQSYGEKLTKPLEYYCEEFTQDDSSRGSKGYGLGLNIVKTILDNYNFKLDYHYYASSKNSFEIQL